MWNRPFQLSDFRSFGKAFCSIPLVSLFIFGIAVTVAAPKDSVAGSGDYVVVGSDTAQGPMIGEILTGANALTLREGESLVMVDGGGAKVKISGPFEGALADAIAAGIETRSAVAAENGGGDWNLVATLANLFSDAGSTTFRSFGGAKATLPDPWLIDIARDGVHCVDASGTPKLWRGPKDGNETATLRNEPTAQEAKVDWTGTADAAAWPIEVSIEDGVQYSIQTQNASLPTLVELRSVPGGLPTRMHAAAWMSDHDCKEQAKVLVLSADIDHLIGELAKDGKF